MSNKAFCPNATPLIIDGVNFECWSLGAGRYERSALDGAVKVWDWSQSSTYGASADGETLCSPFGKPIRFRSQRRACLAALKAYKSNANA